MEREVRYCTTEDGVRIAYCVEGEGPPLLVCPEFAESFSLLHLFPAYESFMLDLGEGRQLIRHDGRGCGLSQRDVSDLSFDGFMKDMEAVVRAAGLRRFAVWGATDGGMLAMRYAAENPRRVTRLVLYGAFARAADVFNRDLASSFAAFARASWESAAPAMATATLQRGYPEAALGLGEMILRSTSGETFARYAEHGYEADVTDLLPSIRAPTLVMHRLDDVSFPIARAQQLASMIPNAQFVPLKGDAHHQSVGDSRAIIEAAHAFLDDRAQQRLSRAAVKPSAPTFRTVLFTDLVGHTEMMSRLGDERGREVLREHERITRELLKAHGGTEVKTMGDGFMASFGSVTRAVECAVALQRAMDGRNKEPGAGTREIEPLRVRVGLNAGEPIEEEGDLFGATVILASRIAARAEGGEILVADTVRGLCSGKGFLFADRGEFVAKGFEEPVRVYEVRWRE